MFEFLFDDSELDALTNLIRMCAHHNQDSLPDWIYFEDDVLESDVNITSNLRTSRHSDVTDKGT